MALTKPEQNQSKGKTWRTEKTTKVSRIYICLTNS